MPQTVQIERVPAHPIAVIRRRVAPADLSRFVPEACGLVWQTIKAANVQDAGRHVAIYRNAGDGLLDVEVGVEVGSPFPSRDAVSGSLTPAGEVATITHFGPYGRLGSAHDAIHQWCAANGRPLTGPRWELYGHWVEEWNANPAKIRTDIYYLLQS